MRQGTHVVRHLAWLCICAALTQTLSGQERHYVRHITPEDGLVSRNVQTAIHQRDGRVWVGTSTGLQLYDGHHFYAIEELSQQSLPELITIEKMQMVDDSMIYCRANHHFFRINTNNFFVEQLDSLYGFATADAEFLDFEFSDMGLLMVMAQGPHLKLIRWQGTEQKTLDSVEMTSPFYGQHIFVTAKHVVWTSENVGNRIIDRSGEKPAMKVRYPVWACLHVDSRGRMWFRSRDEILVLQPPYDTQVEHIPVSSKLSIRNIAESSDGAIWLMGDALLQYTDSLRDFSNVLDQLRIKVIRNLSEDSDRNLWWMTADGILIQFHDEKVFRNYLIGPEFFGRNEIRTIFEGPDGKIYANPATPQRVIFQIDPVSGAEREIVPVRRDGLPMGTWQFGDGVATDAGMQRQWVIDSYNGLCLLEVPSGTVDVLQPAKTCLGVLLQSGCFLFGNTIKQMTVYDRQSGKSTALALSDPALDQYLGYVNNYLVLRDSSLLACTIDGLVQFDLDGNLPNHYATDTDPALPSNNVLVASVDEEGLVWCGTVGGGIFSLDLEQNMLDHIKTARRVASYFMIGREVFGRDS